VFILIASVKNRKQKSRTEAKPEEGRRHAIDCPRSEWWSAKAKSSSKSLYNLTLGYLQRRVKKTVSNTGHCSGRKTVLTERDEQAMANHCLLIARTSWISFETPSSSDHLRRSSVNSDTVIR